MKSTPDLPVDPLGSLGSPIRPAPAPAPDPVKEFELGDWAATLPEGLAEKPAVMQDGTSVEEICRYFGVPAALLEQPTVPAEFDPLLGCI
jgi:hypothetical protein